MTRAIVFLNGDKADYSRLTGYLDKNTILIGCDGGTEKILQLGLKPHAVVGDFDSQDKAGLSLDIEVIEQPKDKDYTDSEAAIRYAIKKGAREVLLTGFSGSRIDHMLGNIYLLNKNDFAGINLKIIEGRQEIYMLAGDMVINGKKGDIISFIPINGQVRAGSSSGLRYDLADYELSLQGNSGISNEMTEDRAGVSLKEGSLLVIHELQS